MNNLLNNLVCGYTCQDHLIVDLDSCGVDKATKIARLIMKDWQQVGSCLIVRSSGDSYHLIFDAVRRWEFIEQIIHTLASINIVEKNYAQVRTFRRDLTLRISDKKSETKYRPVPKPLMLIHNNYGYIYRGGCIKRYLTALSAFRDVKYWIDLVEEKLNQTVTAY